MTEKDIKKLNSNKSINYNSSSRNMEKLDLYYSNVVLLKNIGKVWKRLFYFFFILTIVLSISSIYLLNRNTVYPYLINVNDNGEVIKTEILNKEKIVASEKNIEHFLRKFIIDFRTITLDEKHFNKTIKNANLFLTDDTQKKIQNILISEGTKDYFNTKKTRDVELLSYNKLPSDDKTYQIRWREREYDSNNTLIKRVNKNVILKISFFSPNIDQVLVNPLGIAISEINITQEN